MNPLTAHLHAVAVQFALGEIRVITPLQPGFVAHAHRIQTLTHDVMVKTYDRTRAITERMLEYAPFYLTVTAQLALQTPLHGRMAIPCAGRDGSLLYDAGDFVSAVFVYVHGETPRSNPLTLAQQCDMVTTVGMIHRMSASVSLPTPARIETFVPRWDTAWYAMLTNEWQRLPAALQTMLWHKRDVLITLHQRLRHVGAYLQIHPLPRVLCHSDIHGWNVIVQGDRTCLIDFEGLVYAPAEQDLFCWYGDAVWPQVYATYQTVVGGHTLNAQAMYFYRVKRYLEDIYEWVAELCDARLATHLYHEYTELMRHSLTYCDQFSNDTGHVV